MRRGPNPACANQHGKHLKIKVLKNSNDIVLLRVLINCSNRAFNVVRCLAWGEQSWKDDDKEKRIWHNLFERRYDVRVHYNYVTDHQLDTIMNNQYCGRLGEMWPQATRWPLTPAPDLLMRSWSFGRDNYRSLDKSPKLLRKTDEI